MQAVVDEILPHQIDDLKKTNERIATTNAQLEAEVKRLRNELEQKGKSEAGLVSREEVIRDLKEKFRTKFHGKEKSVMGSQYGRVDREDYNPYIRFVNETILKSSSTK